MTGVVAALLLLWVGAAGSGALGLRRVAAATTVAGCAAAGVVAVAGLRGAVFDATLATGLSSFALHWRLEPLPAFFLLLVAVGGCAAAVYSGPYLAHTEVAKARLVGAMLPLFLASMALVLLAASAAAFLLAWESMSLTSYALVMTDGERPEVMRSGFIYLVMTHAGGLCLLAAFLLLGGATGSLDFAVWAAAAPSVPLALRSAVFVLALLGFGSKAALVPLHVWLPRAHPVAPSHVSALMSGVMLKIAVYGLVLIGMRILGPGPLWWGLCVLVAGGASAVLGALYAVAERDFKRLLAYSSVENVGIVAIGLGVALTARSAGLGGVAAVALIAALFHSAAHALFKTALFLDAGALQHAGAGRDLDGMGGLVSRMPWTGAAVLGASVAIAGLPPFNGFVGEWLTYQSLLRLGHAAGGPGLALAGSAGLLALALAGGLAAAAFVKVAGVGLLGRPRSAEASAVREVPAGMYLPPLVLAALCLAVGMVPGALVLPLNAVATHVLGGGAGAAGAGGPTPDVALLALPWPGVRIAPALPALAAAAIALLASAVLLRGRASRPAPEVRDPWACGRTLPLDAQYSATVYAKPFRQVFAAVYRPVRALEVDSAVHPFFRTRVRYQGDITLVFDRFAYRPALGALMALAALGRRMQSGSLRLYLGYILATLVLLLVLAR